MFRYSRGRDRTNGTDGTNETDVTEFKIIHCTMYGVTNRVTEVTNRVTHERKFDVRVCESVRWGLLPCCPLSIRPPANAPAGESRSLISRWVGLGGKWTMWTEEDRASRTRDSYFAVAEIILWPRGRCGRKGGVSTSVSIV